jgi:undecaprenyl-diphosphatase
MRMFEARRASIDPGESAAPPAIAAFDAWADGLLDRFRSPVLDTLFYGVSSAADHSLLWHTIGVWHSVKNRKPGWALRFAATMGAESAITNGLVKQLFSRRRPEHPIPDGALPMGMHRPITSSFPSGHATAAFTAAAVLAADSEHPVGWYALATLVAYSRVYVRMHHTSDVLVGAACGYAFGTAARRTLFSSR